MQLNYSMYMNTSGYSISAQEYILAMLSVKPDLDIKVHFISPPGEGISGLRELVFSGLEGKTSSNPRLYLFHSNPRKWARTNGKCVGFSIYETIEPPHEWVVQMNRMDAIITASQFNKSTFEQAGVRVPIHVVPHTFDARMFHSGVQPGGRYRKLTYFSMGTWKDRKNWAGLIKGWYEAFDNSHQTALVIKTENARMLQRMVQQIKKDGPWRSKDTAPIYAEQQTHCPFEDIPSIMRKGDIFISASLGEGFGLCGLHAMALGMPVITTRFGGVLEYAKPELCTHLEPSGYRRVPCLDGIPQYANKIWPVVQIKEIAAKLWHTYEARAEVVEKQQSAYKFVHNNFTYDVIGRRMLQALELA